MNPKDLKIICNLRKDARMSLTEMSKKINIPVSTIFDRLRANEDKLIIKHTCLLDFSKIGYNVRANIAVKVDKDCKDQLREFLLKHRSVNSIYKINNGFDFILEGVFRELKELEEFNETLDTRFKVIDRKSFMIIEDLKREGFLSGPEFLD